MKLIRLIPVAAVLAAFSLFSFTKNNSKESFAVAGNCGMCKTRIEKAARTAGAETAEWSTETKMLTITFSSPATLEKIQKAVADAGHDTRAFKASADVYNKLPGCCKYDRSAAATAACCDKENCPKDKQQCADKACCKEAQCEHHDGNHAGMNCGESCKKDADKN